MSVENKKIINFIISILIVVCLVMISYSVITTHEKREANKIYITYTGMVTDVDFDMGGAITRDSTIITLNQTTKLVVYDIQNGLVIGNNYTLVIEGQNLVSMEEY